MSDDKAISVFEAGIKPDRDNANEGTERGLALLDNSLRKLRGGRSILLDKNNNLIAGNKTYDRAADIGLPVRIIETDGKEIIAVKRTDLDLYSEEDKRARQLAYADNKVAEIDLAWKQEQINLDFETYELGEFGFGLDDGFTPNLQPQFSTAKVVDDEVVKEKARLDNRFKEGDEYLQVICPACGEEFYVNKKDIK